MTAGFSTRDMPALRVSLERHGCRFTPRGPDPGTERDGLWIHPGALCGLLLGVSRTTVGWEWSGQPARVARL